MLLLSEQLLQPPRGTRRARSRRASSCSRRSCCSSLCSAARPAGVCALLGAPPLQPGPRAAGCSAARAGARPGCTGSGGHLADRSPAPYRLRARVTALLMISDDRTADACVSYISHLSIAFAIKAVFSTGLPRRRLKFGGKLRLDTLMSEIQKYRQLQVATSSNLDFRE